MPRVGSGCNTPSIQFLILAAVYLFISYASTLIIFASLFPYLSFPLRIDPLRFQAGCRKRRLNVALVFCVVVHFFHW